MDFSMQTCIDSQPEKSLGGDGWCRRKHRVTENFMAAKLKVNFFVLFGSLYWYHKSLYGVRNSVHCVGIFLLWEGEFWLQEVIRARLDTCLRFRGGSVAEWLERRI